jgi:hypothetical protein
MHWLLLKRNRSRVGDWSIFRRESALCGETMAENMDLSPSAARRS